MYLPGSWTTGEVRWFLEGLADYASGQLEHRHRTAARTAIESGVAPKRLAKAWSGPHRYGVSGSLVKYIDETFGRDTVIAMMAATSQAEALGMIKLSEEELLARWRKYVLARS